MPFEIKSILQGKKILILGFGKEGRSTFRLLRKWFPNMALSIGDKNENIQVDDFFAGLGTEVKLITGKNYLDSCRDFDLIIKSPGIPFEKVAEKCDASRITSQTDLFLRAYASRVTGVTGTKGKSTTTSLIHHIMTRAGKKAILAGNIGVPPLDLAEDIQENSEVIFEMSSHQLEQITIAPQIAVILNVFPEHLDHYKDFTAYKMAKFNISRKQPSGGMLMYNADDEIIAELISEQEGKKSLLSFSFDNDKANAYLKGTEVHLVDSKGKHHVIPRDSSKELPGVHNIMNMMAAVLVCFEKGISEEDVLNGLKTYKRLEHRMEYVGKFKGIEFWDDSIATIPQACMRALDTLSKVDLLILGGYDRGLDYSPLYEALSWHTIPYVIFMDEAGKRMLEEFIASDYSRQDMDYFTVENMEEAFSVIRQKLTEGDVCLLSPAAASYGMYTNFEERGNEFKKMAATL